MSMNLNGTDGITWPDNSETNSGKQSCKAWVNFNGSGTVAIRASYNVSSITDNGAGDYTVNFTTAMADANYSAVVNGEQFVKRVATTGTPYQTTSFRLQTLNSAGTLADDNYVNVTIFGN